MENRIKVCQSDLYADRTSVHAMRANPMRLWFAALAHVPICALLRLDFGQIRRADATCGTNHLALLKISSQNRVSVRRVMGRRP